MGIRYGIVSDIHENPEVAEDLIRRMNREFGVHKLILNGDITVDGLEDLDRIVGLKKILRATGDLQTFIQPGSHEETVPWEAALEGLAQEGYKNIIDVRENPIYESLDHNLVFVPGSDVNSRYGSYTFGKELKTGEHKLKDGRWICYTNLEEVFSKLLKFRNNILVCHVPPRFSGQHNVDFTHFIQGGYVMGIRPGHFNAQGFSPISEKDKIEGLIEFKEYNGDKGLLEEVLRERFKDLPIMEQAEVYIECMENRGNLDLRRLCDTHNITSVFCGHFHESGGHAHDWKGNPVEPKKWTESLVLNSGTNGNAAVVEVDGNRMRYKLVSN